MIPTAIQTFELDRIGLAFRVQPGNLRSIGLVQILTVTETYIRQGIMHKNTKNALSSKVDVVLNHSKEPKLISYKAGPCDVVEQQLK